MKIIMTKQKGCYMHPFILTNSAAGRVERGC